MSLRLVRKPARDIQIGDWIFLPDIVNMDQSYNTSPSGHMEKVTKVEELNDYDTINVFYYCSEDGIDLSISTSGSNLLSIMKG